MHEKRLSGESFIILRAAVSLFLIYFFLADAVRCHDIDTAAADVLNDHIISLHRCFHIHCF